MARILLIEPDKLLAATIGDYLQARGHEVAWSQNAQNAVNAADTAPPDAVILELQLAEHSGIEFLYEFRSYSEWQDIPVVIFSNLPADSAFVESPAWRQLGLAAYHYKPRTTLAALAHSVEGALSLEPV